jgi:hypothetical protein
MKEFVVLVYNPEMVNAVEVMELAKRIETECNIVVFKLCHLDMDASPFYLASITKELYERVGDVITNG